MAAMAGSISALTSTAVAGGQTAPAQMTRDSWMRAWMGDARELGPSLHLTRFRDPIYVLLRPISWKPSGDQIGRYDRVDVPSGFVTDLTSIPRAFWSMLRPDGEYTYSAIVHDYLYWEQSRSRQVADEILKLGMEDLRIDWLTIEAIFKAVRAGGSSAWSQNATLRANGERRILKQLPESPLVTWQEWKQKPGVFDG